MPTEKNTNQTKQQKNYCLRWQ